VVIVVFLFLGVRRADHNAVAAPWAATRELSMLVVCPCAIAQGDFMGLCGFEAIGRV
jgi:hypothetical protein